MLLANKGMMALLMGPLRSTVAVSGTPRMSNVVSYIYEGSMWTPQEAETFKNQLTYTTTGMTAGNNLANLFDPIRKRLGYTTDTPPAARGDALSGKAYGRNVDEVCFRMRPPSVSKLTALVAGTVGLLITVAYENYNSNTTGLIVVMSVGLPGSGAEVEIENTSVAIGDILRINDLYIKIDGLLGET